MLLTWLIPYDLQYPYIMGYVNSLIAPIKVLYSDFKDKRLRDYYKLTHNGQVCYLEAALNDSFDDVHRRIYIKDGNKFTRFYIFTPGELKPKYLGTQYIHPVSDFADSGIDFIVVVPLELKPLINSYAINSIINYYRLASKRYSVSYE